MYLKLYNGISTLAWSYLLYSTLEDLEGYLLSDLHSLYHAKTSFGFPHQFLFYLQLTNAIFEISHSISGIVPSPIPTLLLQLLARLLITVGVSYAVPQSAGNFSPAYMVLSITWSVAEIVRYGFYFLKLIKTERDIPYWVTWLRYTAFLVLYPAGLFSELYVVYLSLDSVQSRLYYGFLLIALVGYIPGFLMLYTYMISQRVKVLKKLRLVKHK